MNKQLSYEQINELAQQHGDSFYLLDLQQFWDNLEQFQSAFQSYYPKTKLAYSYKTNYIPLLCNTARESGSFAEVVSPFEYDMAVRLGNDPTNIVYNGPIKPFDSIDRALNAGSIVNLDSVEEYDFVEHLAQQQPDREFKIGLRCNIGVEPDDGSRFGIQTENGDLESVFERATQQKNIQVISLHTHFSYQRSAESYGVRAERLSKIFLTYAKHHPISFFDIGGGFFGPVSEEIAKQFSSPPPTYQNYAEAVGPIVKEAFADLANPPTLVLEPGVGVVANVLSFVCRVECLKKSASRWIANTTGGVQNIKPSKSKFNLPMQVVSQETEKTTPDMPVDICGFTCMEDDVMFHQYENALSQGDYLIFENVGAYSITFKPQFIRSAPAILYRNSENDWEVCRRRETVEDVLSTYLDITE